MEAFVSGFMGATVGSAAFSSTPVCSRRAARSSSSLVMVSASKASPNMPGQAETRGRRTVAFNARLQRNRAEAKRILAKADEYFARSVTMQYKAFACPTGVYDTQCAEGSVKGAAYEKRAMALSAQFRAKQRSPAAKARELYENRRHAIIESQMCQHEEDLFNRFPRLSSAYVLGKSEAMRTCSRYVNAETVVEEYMAASVDKQMKKRAVPGGVYSPACTEGNQKGQAEQARVAALATAYRSAQKSEGKVRQERYNAAKYGRDHFAQDCHHEQVQFAKYPAAAASMRSTSYGY